MSDVTNGPDQPSDPYVPRRLRPEGDDRPRRVRPEGEPRPRAPRPDGEARPRRPRPADAAAAGPEGATPGAERPRRPRPADGSGGERPRRPRPEGVEGAERRRPPAEGAERRRPPADGGERRRPTRAEGADRRAPSRSADAAGPTGDRPRRRRSEPAADPARRRREGGDPWRGQPVGADWTSSEWTSEVPVATAPELPEGSWAGQSAWTSSDAWQPGGATVAGNWTGWDADAEPPPASNGVTVIDQPASVDEVDDLAVVDDGWDDIDEVDDWDDDDGWDTSGQYVRLPRRGGWAIRLGILLLVLLVGLGAVVLWGMRWVDREVNPSGGPGAEVEFVVEEAWTTNRIAEELAAQDVIGNSTIFRYYVRCPSGLSFVLGCDEPIDGSFQAGEYLMNENLDYDEVITRLQAGPIPPEFVQINVPEGLTLEQIAEKLAEENAQFTLEDVQTAIYGGTIRSTFPALEAFGIQSLEGLLFPATYDVDEDSIADEADFVTRMVTEMQNRFQSIQGEVGRDPVIDELGLTDYQVLIVASLIEEEAREDVDRPRIARVIYNRLLRGEPLGIDATARYAGFDPGDSEFDSPYNTRLYPGLVPTPIAAPGEASIQAALAPEAGDWLYYVLDPLVGENLHLFTADYDEFLEAKDRCEAAGLGCG